MNHITSCFCWLLVFSRLMWLLQCLSVVPPACSLSAWTHLERCKWCQHVRVSNEGEGARGWQEPTVLLCYYRSLICVIMEVQASGFGWLLTPSAYLIRLVTVQHHSSLGTVTPRYLLSTPHAKSDQSAQAFWPVLASQSAGQESQSLLLIQNMGQSPRAV